MELWPFKQSRRRVLLSLFVLCVLYGLSYLVYLELMLSGKKICLVGDVEEELDVLCQIYHSGDIAGDLCAKTCAGDGAAPASLEITECHANHYGKHMVFSALLDGKEVIVKGPAVHEIRRGSSSQDAVAHSRWQDLWTGRTDPASLSADEVTKVWEANSNREVDVLLHLAGQDIFPSALSTCSDVFAMEQAAPISYPSYPSNAMDMLPWATTDQWEYRLSVSLLLLDLVDRISSSPHGPFLLCDLKYQHFGLVDQGREGGQVAVVLDGDHFYPETVADRLVNSGAPCRVDDDCDHLDCYGRCDPHSLTCAGAKPVTNTQLLCEKIFMGRYKLKSFKYQPGLLESGRAPEELTLAVERCADGRGSSEREEGSRMRMLIQKSLNQVKSR